MITVTLLSYDAGTGELIARVERDGATRTLNLGYRANARGGLDLAHVRERARLAVQRLSSDSPRRQERKRRRG